MIEELNKRLNAKKYNIYTEEIDAKRKPDGLINGYWLSNGVIYFGHPLLILSKSNQKQFKKIANQQSNTKK